MAQPTMRALLRVPNAAAIAPYEVTRPRGICRTTSYTCSKNSASFLPDGTTFFKPSCVSFFGIRLYLLDGKFVAFALVPNASVPAPRHSDTDNDGNRCRSNSRVSNDAFR